MRATLRKVGEYLLVAFLGLAFGLSVGLAASLAAVPPS